MRRMKNIINREESESKRERKRQRQTDRQTDRQTETETDRVLTVTKLLL